MRRCGRCGFPRTLARHTEWHSDGTVIGRTGIRLPFMFMAVDERESIFAELSEKIGFPIADIFIEAQRNVGRELYDLVRSMYGGFDARAIPSHPLVRPQWLAKLIARAIRNQMATTGIGRVSVERYRAGEYVVLRVANPCLIPAIVGNCIGIYESVERMPQAQAEYHIERGDLVVTLTHGEGEPDTEKRLYLEEVEAGTGPLTFDRCTACGVPAGIGRVLVWDVPRGILMNMESGEREGLVAVQSILAVLRELEAELGDEVISILFEAQKRYSAAHLRRRRWPERPADFWDTYLAELGLRGQGYPLRFIDSGESLSVAIANAYEQDLYAAKLAAGLELLTRRETRIEWSVRERHLGEYVIYTI